MARMSIDDSVGRDPRVLLLAKTLGWSRRETVGALICEVWPICYDQETHIISERLIDAATECAGFAQAMLESELAARDRSGKLRISGAKKRIEYLKRKKAAGREGGLKSAESRRKESKQNASTPQAPRNPPVMVTVPVSVSAPVPVPDPVDQKHTLSKPAAPVRSRGSKSENWTDEELRIAGVALEKLSARSGVQYRGSDAHKRLIIARLRGGATETDLRAIIGYCAVVLGWAQKPEMQKFLRPETLFGPQTIERYLDAARSWFAQLPDDRKSPTTEAT